MQLLTYAISTLGERIHTIVLPEQNDAVKILVVWQKPTQNLPQWHTREDIIIVSMLETGLSRSRNTALENSTTPYLWIADDDIIPKMDNALAQCATMEKNPETVALIGQIDLPNGKPMKAYKNSQDFLKKHQVAGVSSIEIILRTDFLKRHNIKFDTNFGLGAKWTMGEEFIVLSDIIAQKGNVARNNTPLAVHPEITTGSDYSKPAVWQASSAAILRAFGSPLGYVMRMAMLVKKRKDVRGLKEKIQFLTLKV